MSRLQIPYEKVHLNPTDFDPAGFDSILRRFLGESFKTPLVLEVFNGTGQFMAFLREGQFYWAGAKGPSGFEGITIRDFFSRLTRAQQPRIVVYQASLVLYHSLLVYLQKKPDLKISSSLVDLDDLLEGTEKEHRNAIVTALQPGNFVMLRYTDGKAVACYHGLSFRKSARADAREDFLVKVCTMSVHSVFEIDLFTDLSVTHSEDARLIPNDYQGTISSFFMNQPPKLVVRLKNRPLKTYTFTGSQLTIGSTPENDIVIDHDGVSRHHAVIESSKSGYRIRDLGNKNATLLGGRRIETAELKSGDLISVGQYQILFHVPAEDSDAGRPADRAGAETGARPESRTRGSVPDGQAPRLYRSSDNEEFPLSGEKTVIGRGKDADIRLGGFLAPRVTVEITRTGADFVLQKTAGQRDVSINGESMAEKVLEEEDLITIGSEEFVFKR